MQLTPELRLRLLNIQCLVITEHLIYQHLASVAQSPDKSRVLKQNAQEELHNYRYLRKLTGQDVNPDRLTIWKYCLISRVFGFMFSVKLMELDEKKAQSNYAELRYMIPEINAWLQDKHGHERALIEMLDEDRLQYNGSVVQGLTDALVELTGVMAVFTLALQDSKLIAFSGLTTGIAAAISMAVSEYLFTRTKNTQRHPLAAAICTGFVFILAITFLAFPYLLFGNYYLALAMALVTAVLIMAVFNYYISVAIDEPFHKRFIEMAGLSLGLAGILLPIGYIIRMSLGVEP